MHAATAGGAIARLLEMEIEPYQITSALFGVVSQRLLRRKHDQGYRGRIAVGEFVRTDSEIRAGILSRMDAVGLEAIARKQSGFVSMRESAMKLVDQGVTDEQEVTRVLGIQS
jgi:type II secretory ATPase GspE/PulE/Tfp pilus assembly ATPase PilB-like protein